MSEDVQLQREGAVARILFNRPATKNAFTGEMMTELLHHLRALRDAAEVRVVVLQGAGTDYCSGADVGGMSAALAAPGAVRAEGFRTAMDKRIFPLLEAFLALPQPIVSAIRGYVIGIGVQYALVSDLVVASETAKFILPQVRLAHSVDHGESWLLPRRIGMARAMQLCLLGETVGAADAERFGLANWVVADSELQARTETVVEGLLRGAPQSIWRTKALLRQAMDNDLATQFAAERLHASAGAATDDYVEAMRALGEKRRPVFTGR